MHSATHCNLSPPIKIIREAAADIQTINLSIMQYGRQGKIRMN
jgi:hypothetical protein